MMYESQKSKLKIKSAKKRKQIYYKSLNSVNFYYLYSKND